jgi:hypothetical protein
MKRHESGRRPSRCLPLLSAERGCYKQALHWDVVGALDPGHLPSVLDLEPTSPPSKGDEWSAVAARELTERIYGHL